MKLSGRCFRGFAAVLAAGWSVGCVSLEGYTGPSITLSGGYQDWTVGVTLLRKEPARKEPLQEVVDLLAKTGHGPDEPSAKQPITSK